MNLPLDYQVSSRPRTGNVARPCRHRVQRTACDVLSLRICNAESANAKLATAEEPRLKSVPPITSSVRSGGEVVPLDAASRRAAAAFDVMHR
jgi:hypothetical protein